MTVYASSPAGHAPGLPEGCAGSAGGVGVVGVVGGAGVAGGGCAAGGVGPAVGGASPGSAASTPFGPVRTVIVSGPSSLSVSSVMPKPAAAPTATTSSATSAIGIRQSGGRR